MSQGTYNRWGLFKEQRRRQAALAQGSTAGRPIYATDADFTDWARIIQRGHQRQAQLFADGAVGAGAWRIDAAVAPDNNFLLRGGASYADDEAAEAAWVGGHRATLYVDTDYLCSLGVGFGTDAADEIHRRYSLVEAGRLVDEHANYRPGGLVGLAARVGGMGNFAIAGNTETELTLVGFDPVAVPPTDGFYFIVLEPPPVAQAQNVYLDVHLEDWGVEEDAELNHNPGGTALEAMRRLVLVQQVWVDQRTAANLDNPMVQISVLADGRITYVDLTGTRHWLFRLGSLARQPGINAIGDVDVGRERNDDVSSPEVVAARHFPSPCIVAADDPPTTLEERLDRGESVVTVGDGVSSHGMFEGPAGLQRAANCRASVVFVKAGTYNFGGLGTFSIPPGVTVVGEGKVSTLIRTDTTLVAGAGVDVGGSAIVTTAPVGLRDVTVWRTAAAADLPAVRLSLDTSNLVDVAVVDDSTIGPAILVAGDALTSARIEGCRVTKTGDSALRVAVEEAEPPAAQGGSPWNVGDISTSRHPTAGLQILNSYFRTEAATLSEDSPAVYLASGYGLRFEGNVVQTNGIALRTEGLYVDDGAAPLSFSGRDTYLVRDNLFLFVGRVGLHVFPGILLGRGRTSFTDNVVDCASVTAMTGMPAAMVRVQDSGAASTSAIVAQNLVRGGGIGVDVQLVAPHCEVLVSGNVVVPYSLALSMHVGVNTSNADADVGPVIERNLVACGTDGRRAISCSGPGIIRGNHLDGRLTAQVEADAAGESADEDASVGIRATADGADGELLVEANQVVGHGNVGILVRGTDVLVLDNHRRVVLKDDVVDLHGRGLKGILTRTSTETVRIEGCTVARTRREGIHVATATTTKLVGCLVQESGQDFGDAGDVAMYHAGIRNGGDVQGCIVEHPVGPGIVVADMSATIADCRVADGDDVGILVPGDLKQFSVVVLERCTVDTAAGYGIHAMNCREVALHGCRVIRAGDVQGIGFTTCLTARMRGCVVEMPADSAWPHLRIDRVTTRLDVEGCEFRSSGNHAGKVIETVAVDAATTSSVRIVGCTVQKGDGPGLDIQATSNVLVQDCVVEAGLAADAAYAPGNRSLVISHTGTDGRVEVRGCHLSHGLHATTSFEGVPASILNNACRGLGILVRARRATIVGNEVQAVAGTNAIDGTSIWLGGTGQASADVVLDQEFCWHAVIADNTIHALADVGQDLSVGAATGRSAGIVTRCSYATIEGNRIWGTQGSARIGVLVGALNYLATSVANPVEYRVGAYTPIVVQGNSFRRFALLVMVARESEIVDHMIVGNRFMRGANDEEAIRLYGQADVVGNTIVVVRGNEALFSANPDNWGLFRKTAGIPIEVGKTTEEIAAALSDASAIRRSNTLQLGANL